jgi:hypothetical protein
MLQESMRTRSLPADLLADVAAVLMRHGYALASSRPMAEVLAELLVPIGEVRVDQVLTAEDVAVADGTVVQPAANINPLCGHPLGQQCHMCGVCLDCQDCYCDELSAGPTLRELAEIKDRRIDRWQLVAAAAAKTGTAPAEVAISDDGWSLSVRVASESQVVAFGEAFGLDSGQLQVRVYSPSRGTVVRETSLAQVHPFAVRVWCDDPVTNGPPGLRRDAAAAIGARR